jgi:Protein of unknown function (DUF1573)
VLHRAASEEGLPLATGGGQPRLLATSKDSRVVGSSAEPDPSTTELVVDFGAMPQHSSSRAEFIFRNVGDAVLELKKGKSTCRCTVSEISATEVKPGEETVVALSWKTDAMEGPFRHRADIVTNDPSHRMVHLLVKGTLTRGVSVDPRDLSLGRIGVRESKQAEFTVVAFHSGDFEIRKCSLMAPDTAESAGADPLAKLATLSYRKLTPAELKSVEPLAKSGYRVTFSLKPGLPLGQFSRRIQVTTNTTEPVDLSVHGLIIGDISVAEVGDWLPRLQYFDLGEIKSEEGKSSSLSVIVRGENFRNVKVKVKRTIPSELQAEVGAPLVGEQVARWPVKISIPPGTPAMSHVAQGEYGKVILETTHPDYKEFVIDVSLLVIKARP